MEITMQTFIIVLPIVFLAGLIDAIAGGGGLISMPGYLAAGLPPHLALGNNKFSSCFGTLFTTGRYFRHGMIDLKVAVTSAMFALVGSWLGAKVVLMIKPDFLRYILAVLLPAMTLFTLLKKDIGLIDTSHQHSILKKILLGITAGFVIGFYDGFFGPGTGSFLILFFTLALHYDFVVANGNTKVINLASNIAAMITFLVNGKVLLVLGIPAAVAGIAGNLIGSKMVVKNGSKLIRPVFILVFVLLFLKIIWDIFK